MNGPYLCLKFELRNDGNSWTAELRNHCAILLQNLNFQTHICYVAFCFEQAVKMYQG